MGRGYKRKGTQDENLGANGGNGARTRTEFSGQTARTDENGNVIKTGTGRQAVSRQARSGIQNTMTPDGGKIRQTKSGMSYKEGGFSFGRPEAERLRPGLRKIERDVRSAPKKVLSTGEKIKLSQKYEQQGRKALYDAERVVMDSFERKGMSKTEAFNKSREIAKSVGQIHDRWRNIVTESDFIKAQKGYQKEIDQIVNRLLPNA